MPQRITSVEHDWQGAACITLTDAQARTAEARLSIRLPDGAGGDVKIRVIEVSCGVCGGVFEDWYDTATKTIFGCVSNPGPTRPDGVPPHGPHQWVGSVLVPLDDERAQTAVLAKTVTLPGQRLTFQIIETYCEACRRPYTDVAEVVCEAAASNEHLRGGPIGERKRRTPAGGNPEGEDMPDLAEAR